MGHQQAHAVDFVLGLAHQRYEQVLQMVQAVWKKYLQPSCKSDGGDERGCRTVIVSLGGRRVDAASHGVG